MMSENPMVTISIYVVHGEDIIFKAPITPASSFDAIEAIEKATSSNAMIFELDGKLLVIPNSNIRFVEVSPVPADLPVRMIRGGISITEP